MSTISDLLDSIDAMGNASKMLLASLLIILAMVASRYIIVRPWFYVVKMTDAEWDDKLHAPISKRLYVFVIIAGIHISILWILGVEDGFSKQMFPLLDIMYILLGTSLASVSAKHVIPAFMDRFSSEKSVTVSGSNPLVTFVIRAMVWFGGIYLVLEVMELEVGGIVASLALFSIIIGLAMQQTLGNIVTSFMLALDQPFEVGDRIEVEGQIGSVVSVGILSTKILTREETLVVIPNNTLVDSTIINHARGGGDGVARRISLVLDVGVDYREDIDHVKYTLLKLMRECPYVIDSPEPRVLLNELGDFAKIFRLYSGLKDYNDEWVAKDWILKAVDEQFAEESITIPYPTTLELQSDYKSPATSRKKTASIRVARMQMVKEDKQLRKEREAARNELELISEQLKDIELDKAERVVLEESARELERVISMFEAGDS